MNKNKKVKKIGYKSIPGSKNILSSSADTSKPLDLL